MGPSEAGLSPGGEGHRQVSSGAVVGGASGHTWCNPLSCLPHPQLLFQEDLEITHMYSAEGEEVQLSFSIYPSSNVEDWLREVELSMKTSIRDMIERAIKAYPTVSHASHPSTASQPPRSSVCSLIYDGSWAACMPHPQATALGISGEGRSLRPAQGGI